VDGWRRRLEAHLEREEEKGVKERWELVACPREGVTWAGSWKDGVAPGLRRFRAENAQKLNSAPGCIWSLYQNNIFQSVKKIDKKICMNISIIY
jgi:hypothetical protein